MRRAIVSDHIRFVASYKIKFGIVPVRLAMLALAIAVGACVSAKDLPAHPLDLNTASVVELEELPGVGPEIAKAIAQFREKSGPFKRVEELLAIRGISQRKYENIRSYVYVQKPR